MKEAGSQSRGRRAARSLGVALFAFVSGQLVLNLALETVRPEWRDPEYGWRLKAVRALDASRGKLPLIIALGSSRTQMGLSPRDLGLESRGTEAVVYNFGQAGSGPIQMALNLGRVLDAGVKPDAVLLEIMPATLTYDGTSETFFHESVGRLSVADLKRLEPYSQSPDGLTARWFAYRMFPIHTLRFLLLSHWLPSLLPWQSRIDFQWRLMDSRGWAPFPFETIDETMRAEQSRQARADYEAPLGRFEVSAMSLRILRDIVARCRDQRIALAFYLMPEGSEFRRWLPQDGRIKLNRCLAELSNDGNIPVFDASNWLPDDAFADGHHMLRNGARQFSQRFGREYLGDWISGLDRR